MKDIKERKQDVLRLSVSSYKIHWIKGKKGVNVDI